MIAKVLGIIVGILTLAASLAMINSYNYLASKDYIDIEIKYLKKEMEVIEQDIDFVLDHMNKPTER